MLSTFPFIGTMLALSTDILHTPNLRFPHPTWVYHLYDGYQTIISRIQLT